MVRFIPIYPTMDITWKVKIQTRMKFGNARIKIYLRNSMEGMSQQKKSEEERKISYFIGS